MAQVISDPRLDGDNMPSMAKTTVTKDIPKICIPEPINETKSLEFDGGRKTSP